MDLRRVVWSWPTVEQRLLESQPEIGQAVRRSCRPIAAERRPDGRLTLILGCWWAGDERLLGQPVVAGQFGSALSAYLDDEVRHEIVPWPGGEASGPGLDTADEIAPPDILAGLPLAARQEAAACESAIHRLFFAEAWRAGLRLRCQHQAMSFRLDFALPSERVGVEVFGWEGPGRRGARWERFELLGDDRWQVLTFGGRAVYEDVAGCVALLREARSGRGEARRARF